MLWTDGGRALSGPKLVIPWNSPWQPKNNLAWQALSPMLRKQLIAASNGSVVNQIPGRRRYDPKMGKRREPKDRRKIHLRRPNEAKSMCGSTVNPISVRDKIDEVTCMHCEKMYANNVEWYKNKISSFDCQYSGEIDGSCIKDKCWAYDHSGPRCALKEVTDGRHSTTSTEGSG